ncbi:hypothetical protein UFOVP29_49 [uncultured Caudovirales phage]|uniref:Uncharacterized protein n=1 Tax=uncultured Caudovirales phage TaxID=2100421 RepID=A0A6J5KRH1_9CAUD|nr:hypothetical protein UFOVP29_49 [uncultured Caudovirales phage]
MDTYETIPYTYLIGWSKYNKWYYGVRYANGCNPTDLWVTYKTSSKYVKRFLLLYGDPDIIIIRKTFSNKDKARLWENRVLTRMKVTESDKWLNETNNLSISYEKGIEGSKKAADLIRGKHFTQDHKNKIRASLLGKGRPQSVRDKISKTRKDRCLGGHNKGTIHPPHVILLMRERALLRPKKECPWCQKVVDKMNYKKWHGDACKFNVITIYCE